MKRIEITDASTILDKKLGTVSKLSTQLLKTYVSAWIQSILPDDLQKYFLHSKLVYVWEKKSYCVTIKNSYDFEKEIAQIEVKDYKSNQGTIRVTVTGESRVYDYQSLCQEIISSVRDRKDCATKKAQDFIRDVEAEGISREKILPLVKKYFSADLEVRTELDSILKIG